MRKRLIYLSLPLLLTVGYLLGPHPARPVYETDLPRVAALDALEDEIAQGEALHKLRPDNEARIVWANDSLKVPTAYSIVYLHGFSASQEEGDPVHRHIAGRIGCDLYLARQAEHGIDTSDMLVNLTVEKYWASARRALSIGRRLGHKVILMGTSTGATQALQLAAEYPDAVQGLILYSPNLAINNPAAFLLNNPWGLQIARLVMGGKYNPRDTAAPPEYFNYWSNTYRLEAATQLEEMLETGLPEEKIKAIRQPLLLLYYYKNEKEQDPVVRVDAMLEAFSTVGTPEQLKREKALPGTGNHVIASPIRSKDIASVELETAAFLREVMKMPETGR